MVNSADTSTMLLSKKADSRLTMESSSGCSFSKAAQQACRPNEQSRKNATSARKHPPTGPEENAWLDEMIPERVRNVAKIVRLKATMISDRFHTLSMRRRSCTCTECKNAVAGSHG